jgi:hypothetical protein
MKTIAHSRYVVELFLEWDKFETKVVEKIKPYFVVNNFFPPRKSCRLWDGVEK